MSKEIPMSFFMQMEYLRGKHMWQYGVSWSVQRWRDNAIRFSSFFRHGGSKGDGAKALAEVCDAADIYQLEISLFTEFDPLVAYYGRLGFKVDPHYSHPKYWEMVRKPDKPKYIIQTRPETAWDGFNAAVARHGKNLQA